MDIQILISRMIVLFLVIFLGYFIYKIKLVDDNFVKKFTKLILDVTLPAMILASVLKLEERQAVSDVITALAVSSALFFVILPIFGWLLAKALFVKKGAVGLYTFMTSYSNIGFMGMPVLGALYGNTGLFYAAIFNLVFNIAIYSIGIWIMNRDSSTPKRFDLKSLLHPGIIVAFLSICFYFTGLQCPVVIADTVDTIGSITSPAAMILIGCSLAKMDVKSVFSEWRLYPWTILKQLAVPLILWIPFTWVIKNELLLNITYILTGMPVANTSVLFATNFGGDDKLAAKSVFLTTLISLVTVPVIIMIVT